MPIKLAKMVFKDVGKYGGRLFRFYFIKDGEKSDTMVRSYVGFLEELDNAWGETLVVVEKIYKWNRKSKTEWKYFTTEEQIAYVVNQFVNYDAVPFNKVKIERRSYLSDVFCYAFSMSSPIYYTVQFTWYKAPNKETEDKMRKILDLFRNLMFSCEKEEIGQTLYDYLKSVEW